MPVSNPEGSHCCARLTPHNSIIPAAGRILTSSFSSMPFKILGVLVYSGFWLDEKEENPTYYYDSTSLQDKFQVAYSGGKESALTAYLLHEITGEKIYGTSSLYNREDKTFPKWMIGKEAKVRPWQTSTIGIAAIVHAVQNRCKNVCIGFEHAGNLPKPNQYSVHGRAYHQALERYLSQVTEGMTFTSPVNFGIGTVILKILKERYPEAIKHLDCVPPTDVRYHLMLSYLDIPFPEYIKPFTKNLETFQDCPTYNRIMHWIEARHLIAKMKGNPLLGNNPLQFTGESYPWIEKALWGCSKPRIFEKEIKKIIGEHVDFDYNNRLREGEEIFTDWLKERK